jgi:hypothetical protein
MSFQVLGLLGQAGSGKDVVADWFCKKGFVKVAFADAMKRYVNDLFLYTPEQLWGASELRNVEHAAGDRWWMDVVTRWGRATNKFVNEMFYHSFSNGHVGRVDAYISLMQWFTNLRIYTQKISDAKLSPRVVLQTLGTEWGRKLDENLWTGYVYDRVIPALKTGIWYCPERGLFSRGSVYCDGADVAAGIIIPDHRFLSEVLQTQKHDGYVLRITRPGKPVRAAPGVARHASEQQQLELPIPVNYDLEMPEGLDLVVDRLERLWKDQPWANP